MVRKKDTRAVEVQTGVEGGLGYQWNIQGVGMSYLEPPFGLGYADPTPIASHVVSPDAIEGMIWNSFLSIKLGSLNFFIDFKCKL